MNTEAPFVPTFTFDIFGAQSTKYQEHEMGSGIEIFNEISQDEDSLDADSSTFNRDMKDAGVELLPSEQFFTDGAVPPLGGAK